jgi:hypothetical protein
MPSRLRYQCAQARRPDGKFDVGKEQPRLPPPWKHARERSSVQLLRLLFDSSSYKHQLKLLGADISTSKQISSKIFMLIMKFLCPIIVIRPVTFLRIDETEVTLSLSATNLMKSRTVATLVRSFKDGSSGQCGPSDDITEVSAI